MGLAELVPPIENSRSSRSDLLPFLPVVSAREQMVKGWRIGRLECGGNPIQRCWLFSFSLLDRFLNWLGRNRKRREFFPQYVLTRLHQRGVGFEQRLHR